MRRGGVNMPVICTGQGVNFIKTIIFALFGLSVPLKFQFSRLVATSENWYGLKLRTSIAEVEIPGGLEGSGPSLKSRLAIS